MFNNETIGISFLKMLVTGFINNISLNANICEIDLSLFLKDGDGYKYHWNGWLNIETYMYMEPGERGALSPNEIALLIMKDCKQFMSDFSPMKGNLYPIEPEDITMQSESIVKDINKPDLTELIQIITKLQSPQ